MPSLTIKAIPQDLYERLKQRALWNRRSMNSEVLVCLERALGAARIDAADILARADALRDRTKGADLDDETLRKGKTVGRP